MDVPLEQAFAEHRRFLWGLSYRMTGSAADADDVVQDTFVRAIERPPRRTDAPLRPWLTKVALNLSRDLLRRRKRREYVGPWLPSPIETGDEAPPSHEPDADKLPHAAGTPVSEQYDLLESVSFAFLLALERLTPSQRAVLLLRDVFDYSVKEAADALDMTEANVKTTHHRARRTMASYDRDRRIPTGQVQDASRRTLFAFLDRLGANDVAGVEALLAEDVRTLTDGGGEYRAALRPILGREKVMRLFFAIVQIDQDLTAHSVTLNGLPAVVFDVTRRPEHVAPRTTLQVDLDADGRIARIYSVSAPRKLSALDHALGA